MQTNEPLLVGTGTLSYPALVPPLDPVLCATFPPPIVSLHQIRLYIMTAKYLRLIFSSILVMSAATEVHASSSLTNCFPNMEEFMVARYGADFREDDNLIITEAIFGKTKFTVFEDVTSGTNRSIVLLRTNSRKEMCVVLRTSPTADIQMVKVNAVGVPVEFKSVDQAPPGMPANEIFYRLTGNMNYFPVICNHLTWEGKRRVKKRVSCEDNRS